MESPMRCAKCQHENRQGARFCEECGAKLPSICPNCGSEIVNPQAKFCDRCGARLSVGARRAVPVQHETVPKLEDMQKQLQSRIPQSLVDRLFAGAKQMQGEYRLVTAVFADVSGSSGMAREMPLDQYVETMNDCFKMMVDTISIKYEGSINRFIGDCVLAFFGAPITHENDAERAILAALDIRDGARELSLDISIGINTGMTYVGEMGSDLYFERSAWGPDVDFARRLQEAAGPGEIHVGAATYRLTSRIFDFEGPVDIEVKGTEERQVAYPVLRVREHPEKLRGIEGLRARMIGREREFADLKEAADDLIFGRGNIVSIIGEAGLGKSRLALELKEYLKDKDVSWYEGRSVSIGQTVSYWPFLDILRTYVNLTPGLTGGADDGKSPHPPLQRGSKEAVPFQRGSKGVIPLQGSEVRESQGGELSESDFAGKLKESITDLFPQRWEDILPFLGHLLSIKFGDELDDKLAHFTPEQVRHQTLMRLRGVFTAISRRRPLLLILEDLHWADDLSLDLISLLMDDLAENPLMLLCIYRPERQHRSWQIGDVASRKCLERYTEITLKQLSAVQSRQLVESLLEIENLPETTKDMILKKSEGNPFFIEEVIRSLIERDLVYRADDRWKARREIEDIDVPDTIQSVLLSRVDRLEDEAKYVLQCASVIGRLFRYRLLDHLAQHERDLEEHLSQLEERDLVYEERSVPEREYAFKHALTQEATYQCILERTRSEFHHQVGEGIEALYRERLEEYYEELAYHYSRSTDKEKAVQYLIKAGDKCKQLYANQDAIGYFNEALAALDELSETDEHESQRLKVMEGLGDVHHTVGKHDDAIAYFEKAVALGTKQGVAPARLAELYFKIGDACYFLERFDKMIGTAQAGLAVLGEDITCPHVALLYENLRQGYQCKGDTAKMDEYTSKNAAIVKNLGYFDGIHKVYGGIAWTNGFLKEDPEYSILWMKECMEICERHNDRKGIARCCHWLGDTLNWQKNSREAIHWYKKSITIAEDIGYVDIIMHSHVDLGGMLVRLKEELEEAEEHLKVGGNIAREVGHSAYVAMAYACLGELYLVKQNWDKAIDYKMLMAEIAGLGKIGHGHIPPDVILSDSASLARFLGTLEEVCEKAGRRGEFILLCDRLMEWMAEDPRKVKLTQWYLAPKELSRQFTQTVFLDEFDGSVLSRRWQWINPRGDCSYDLTSKPSWLEIRVASGCDLYGNNLSAPRLLQEISGEFAIETKIAPASEEIPTVGGILIWKGEDNYIRFERGSERGMHGPFFLRAFPYIAENEIGLSGNVRGEWEHFGRGMLVSEIIYLRIERIGDTFSAYCSSDGANWLTCGQVKLDVQDPIHAGIHAIGNLGMRGGSMATATSSDYVKIFRAEGEEERA